MNPKIFHAKRERDFPQRPELVHLPGRAKASMTTNVVTWPIYVFELIESATMGNKIPSLCISFSPLLPPSLSLSPNSLRKETELVIQSLSSESCHWFSLQASSLFFIGSASHPWPINWLWPGWGRNLGTVQFSAIRLRYSMHSRVILNTNS